MRVTRAAACTAPEKKTATTTKEDSTSFRILDLPPELVEQIFDHLTEHDEHALPNVRRVCRAFRDLSFKPFGTKYFQHLIVMLHPLSLRILLDIACHRRLSRYVKQITVSGERIGGIINMLGHEDEQMNQNLQTRMLNSGTDHLMLTRIFGKLSGLNLGVVRIDNESFRVNDYPNALRCGSRYIFKGVTATSMELSQDWKNPAVSAVVTSLMEAGIFPCLEMVLNVNTATCENFFDPTDALWKTDIGERIMLLELTGELDSQWALDLLRSATGLYHLEVHFAEGLFGLSHPETGLLKWPELQTLYLHNVNCDGQDLRDLFSAHMNTLSSIYLYEVHLMSGSWKDIFPIWRKQLSLQQLTVDILTETTAPATQLKPFWVELPKIEDLPPLKTTYSSRADIVEMLDALLHDFSTTDFQHSTGYLDSPMYRVDFRLACAVHVGRAEIRDGLCHLLEL